MTISLSRLRENTEIALSADGAISAAPATILKLIRVCEAAQVVVRDAKLRPGFANVLADQEEVEALAKALGELSP